jgi:hypothetical protein
MVHSIMLKFEKIWLSHTLNIIWKPKKSLFSKRKRAVNVKYTVIKLNLYFMVHSHVWKFEKIWLSGTLIIIRKPSVTDGHEDPYIPLTLVERGYTNLRIWFGPLNSNFHFKDCHNIPWFKWFEFYKHLNKQKNTHTHTHTGMYTITTDLWLSRENDYTCSQGHIIL